MTLKHKCLKFVVERKLWIQNRQKQIIRKSISPKPSHHVQAVIAGQQ